MARLAEPDDQPERRQKACARVRKAMAAHPELVSGSKAYDAALIKATKGGALVKHGAEAVFAASLPELGLGVALKIDDGGSRGSRVAMGALLRRLGILGDELIAAQPDLVSEGVFNRVGLRVGEIRAALDGPLA